MKGEGERRREKKSGKENSRGQNNHDVVQSLDRSSYRKSPVYEEGVPPSPPPQSSDLTNPNNPNIIPEDKSTYILILLKHKFYTSFSAPPPNSPTCPILLSPLLPLLPSSFNSQARYKCTSFCKLCV